MAHDTIGRPDYPSCENCGESHASVIDRPHGTRVCGDCYRATLAHGHDHIGHEEIIADCPSCDRCYGYTVDQHGIIASPGKFEGEYQDAPYWYAQALDGADDEYDGYMLIKVTEADRKIWPELQPEIYGVVIREDANGFAYCRHVDQSEYTRIVRELEADQADQADQADE